MKKFILAAVALSFLAVPAAQAQSRQGQGPQPRYEQGFKQGNKHGNKHGNHSGNKHGFKPQKQFDPRYHAAKPPRPDMHKPHWAQGKKVPAWQRKQVVHDYHRHGLRRPGPGQQWVKVGNDYLLVSILSGIIGGIIAAR